VELAKRLVFHYASGAILTTVDLGGGVPCCLYRAMANQHLVVSGLKANNLLMTYLSSCDGLLSGGFNLAEPCHGTKRYFQTQNIPTFVKFMFISFERVPC
jgi:hypothetical protein